MKKRELIYIHGLLDRVSILMRKHGDLSEEALDSYRALGVSPTAVYQSKNEHEQAVETLALTLAAAIEEPSETEEQSIDHSDHSARMT